MNLADVMDEIGDQLDTIPGLRVFRWPPSTVTPPAAVVTYPDSYTYDSTMRRGADRVVLPVVVMVGRVSDRSSRDRLAEYADGAGARSIKAVIESHGYVSCDSVRVQEAEFDLISMAGVEYVSATFNVDIAGPGG